MTFKCVKGILTLFIVCTVTKFFIYKRSKCIK